MAYLADSVKRKINEYLKKTLGMFDYRNGWLKGDCPECGHEKKFGVNLGTNRSNCFVCGYSKKPIKVIMDYENFHTYAEVMNLLNNLDGLDFSVQKNVQRMSYAKDAVLPEGFKLLKFGDTRLGKSARSYMRKRGFDIDELSMAGFGYCTSGEYFGYIIMPFYIDNKLVYFNARRYMASGTKYNNPNIEDFGIGKSVLIYNRDALNTYDTVYLVESILNARTLGDRACSFGGKSLSESQINDIIKSSCKRVIILLDPDAYKEAIKLGLRLIDHKKVKVVLLPGDNDVNDLGRKKTMQHVYSHRYLSYTDLIKINNDL